MSDDTSIDLVVFQIIAEREHGSLVATHEPSALESSKKLLYVLLMKFLKFGLMTKILIKH